MDKDKNRPSFEDSLSSARSQGRITRDASTAFSEAWSTLHGLDPELFRGLCRESTNASVEMLTCAAHIGLHESKMVEVVTGVIVLLRGVLSDSLRQLGDDDASDEAFLALLAESDHTWLTARRAMAGIKRSAEETV